MHQKKLRYNIGQECIVISSDYLHVSTGTPVVIESKIPGIIPYFCRPTTVENLELLLFYHEQLVPCNKFFKKLYGISK